MVHVSRNGGDFMAKAKGVSSKTHTKQQLNDYANQHNPNNKAFRANKENKERQEKVPFDYDYSYCWNSKDDF